MTKYLATLLLLLAVCSTSIPLLYHKVVHNVDPEAKCLDGSPAFLYINEGGDTKNILIYFLGGGMCGDTTLESTLESCYKRSKDFLGSQKRWPAYLPEQLSQGYLSTNPKENSFANWTKIFVPYCDGNFHQGNTKEPVKYKDTQLYFRGGVNTRAHIKYINQKYNLKGADKVIVTGMSAGGIAVHMWTNYIKDIVQDDSKVFPIADSGVFIQFDPMSGNEKISHKLMNIFQVGNVDESTPLQACNKQFQEDQWKCLNIEATYTYLRGRYLIINSEYDAWAIPNILGIKCLKSGKSGQTPSSCSSQQMAYIEKYRSAYKEFMSKFMATNTDLSVWSIACSNHVYACRKDFYDDHREMIPANTGRTIKDVVDEFVLHGTKNVVFDPQGWPSNTGCAM